MAADALYWLEARFERAVVALSCSSPSFWVRVGHAVDPECLNVPEARLAMRAARQVAADTGAAPGGSAIVLQRLRRWMEGGKASYEDCLAVGDLLLLAEDDPPLAEAAVVAELAPVLRKRVRHAAVLKVMEEAKRDDADDDEPFPEALKLIKKAATLGAEVAAADAGVLLGEGSYEVMEAARHAERLSTGIEDLDILLKGGPRRGGFQLWLGGTNSGKSMALIQRIARAMRLGMTCGLATLELSVEEQLARLKSNLTGVPIDDILDDPQCVRPYLQKMALGPCYVQTFTAYATTVADVAAWVDVVELAEGRRRARDGVPLDLLRVPLDLLAVDYADLLGAPTSAGKEGEHGYTVGKHVFGALRLYAEGEKEPGDGGHPGRNLWVDSASAATRSKDKRKRITTDDVADSLHKARRATLVVSINPSEDGGIEFFVTKNTHGKAQFSVGPLPPDFECGRIAPVIEVP